MTRHQLPRLLSSLFSALGLLLALTVLPAPPASADPPAEPLPVTWNVTTVFEGVASRTLKPGWNPAGSNDPSCQLTEERPRPVVLVNFTTGSGWEWGAGSPYLRNQGFCVFHFTYGNLTGHDQFPIQAIADIRDSARELAAFVDQVRAETGVPKVDLVGWSQGGGMLPHYYINFLGGAAKVNELVAIAPGNHGTDGSGLLRPTTLGPLMYPILKALLPAFGQQIAGTELVEEIYRDGDTRPGPHYTTIVSKYDWIATPYTNQFLESDPDALDGRGNVTNILLQQGCAKDRSEHISTGFSERTWRHVVNALAPAEATPVPCIKVTPYWGSGL